MEDRDPVQEARGRLPAKPTKAALLYVVESARLWDFELFVRESIIRTLENLPAVISSILARRHRSRSSP